LLKKGVSAVAHRARAASRVLEEQVGVNPRVRVQRDQAFVLWDKIDFAPPTESDSPTSPEWVRRTICCAKWEVDHADEELADAVSPPKNPKVVIATLAQPPQSNTHAPSSPTSSVASPVPLPAPQANKHEPRSAGILVNQWARRAGLTVLEITPTPANESHGRTSSEEERDSRPSGRRGGAHGGGGRRRNQTAPSVGADRQKGLVERPPAVKAMMEAVAEPSRVVRVLARGEKLEP
jgi:hypothetical protein